MYHQIAGGIIRGHLNLSMSSSILQGPDHFQDVTAVHVDEGDGPVTLKGQIIIYVVFQGVSLRVHFGVLRTAV